MNKIKETLALLDLEIDEEFTLAGYDGTCKINAYGTVLYFNERTSLWTLAFTLSDILKGNYEIIKQRKFPKNDLVYYFVDTDKTILWNIWGDNYVDVVLFKLGNFYLNKEEITQEEINKWVKFYNDPELIERGNNNDRS